MVGLAVLIVVGAGLWLYGRYQTVKASVFDKRKVDIAVHIQNRAGALIQPESFSDKDSRRQQQIFQRFFEAVQSPQIFRIKVFNREPKIIWSNLKEIIGQDASANLEVKQALDKGEITLKFKSLKPEQVTERQYGEFTETYVPIRDAKGRIIGVIEVYQTFHSARDLIRTEFQRLTMTSIPVILIGYFATAFIFRFLVKTQ
jgi:hypothetical protein